MQQPLTVSLDGEWAFYYSPLKFNPEHDALPDRKLFSGRMVTPGYWDDHYELFDEEDFFGRTARFNPDYRKPHFPMARSLTPHACSSFLIGTGFYWKQLPVNIPQGAVATLSVGPAMWGCSVFCNGRFAGQVTGYSTASDFTIGELLLPGDNNEIIIVVDNVHDDGGAYCRVDGSHDGAAFGARPGQHRGLAAQGYQSERAGIGGGVSLKITPGASIVDWFVSFEEQIPHWRVTLFNGAEKMLHWTIRDDAEILLEGSEACSSEQVNFFSRGFTGERWSDRAPHLYTLTLELLEQGGQVIDAAAMQWGARTVRCLGTQILVNDIPTYFRGVTEHCYFPESCNPHFDFDKYCRDLGVLKKAGFNFIRCHTWCPPEPFYTACDALGFLVQTELPSVWSWEEADAIIQMIRKHPSAVILCEGNEKIIDEPAIERLRRLAANLRKDAPGMLFNPQDAMRGIEYEFTPQQQITMEPFRHDAKRLAEVSEFSDVFGSLGNSYFSYLHDRFPGIEAAERDHAIYGKPCLSHEIGILGGYLDFSLEKRYEDTFIGTDMFQAARKNMQKHGVWDNAQTYFEHNCRFITSLRKQLIENLRSCPSITGYDYLGGIDTHWHLTGYPCGIFNEFYEEKPGESIADVRRYNAETVLLCSALNMRNRTGGKSFSETMLISYFGAKPLNQGILEWYFKLEDGTVVASGKFQFGDIECGTVSTIGAVEFTLPVFDIARRGTLQVVASTTEGIWENHWNFWVFPPVKIALPANVRCVEKLDEETVRFAAAGGAVLLTRGFPGETIEESFRTHTSGRAAGHAGTIIHQHPLWKNFPHEGYADWQFFPMMTGSHSLVNDAAMPAFTPLLELIPSFKLVRRKSLLSEFVIGCGRLMICGLRLGIEDPAAQWMQQQILNYLGSGNYANAPEWGLEALLMRVNGASVASSQRFKKVDAGGRPIED